MTTIRRFALLTLFVGLLSPLAFGQLYFFSLNADGAQEAPTPRVTPATGSGDVVVDAWNMQLTVNFAWSGLLGPQTDGHFHRGAFGVGGPVIVPLGIPPSTPGLYDHVVRPITSSILNDFLAGNVYINIHSSVFPGGEIRGQAVLTGSFVPEPSTYGILGAAAVLATITIHRRWKKRATSVA